MTSLAEAKSLLRHPNRLLNASGSHYGVTPEEHKNSARILSEDPNFTGLMERVKNPSTSPKEQVKAFKEAWKIHDSAWMYPKEDTKVKPTPG